MPPELISAMTVYGPLGIGCAALFWLFLRERDAHRRTQEARLREMREFTESRISDARTYQDQMTENMRTLDRALAVMESRNG